MQAGGHTDEVTALEPTHQQTIGNLLYMVSNWESCSKASASDSMLWVCGWGRVPLNAPTLAFLQKKKQQKSFTPDPGRKTFFLLQCCFGTLYWQSPFWDHCKGKMHKGSISIKAEQEMNNGFGNLRQWINNWKITQWKRNLSSTRTSY